MKVYFLLPFLLFVVFANANNTNLKHIEPVLIRSPFLQAATDVGSAIRSGQRVLKVPAEFPSIAAAVANSMDGDWIIISPGTYMENEIEINKAVTISSEWKLSGDESKIEETIIDSEDKILFTINTDGVEISGLKLINGNHTLNIKARATIVHNHFSNNLDGMSFESDGGGYVAYNTAENDRDDALDLDITLDDENSGSDILVEHNVFINSNDDGIEIRLFKAHNQDIKYTIRQNTIMGSNNAAVQLISYDEFTGKEFQIHHNLFLNCKTGLGSMEGAHTREDLSGAKKMDEKVYFYNNTVTGCQMGATGGNRIIAFNNLIFNNSLGGFKLFGANSVIRNNLFFQNGENDFIEIDAAVTQKGNIFSTDPSIDENTFYPSDSSPCIDAGITTFGLEGAENPTIPNDYFTGKAPDIGAIERGLRKQNVHYIAPLQVDAGEDRAIKSPVTHVVLVGKTLNTTDRPLTYQWKQEKGPAQAELTNSNQLVASVKLQKEGLYQFSMSCSDSQSIVSDMVTIRYIKEGEGKQLFLSEDPINKIEVKNFAYTYGNVKEIGENNIELNSEIPNDKAQIEFSIGVAEEIDCEMWLFVKSTSGDGNKIRVEFNQDYVGEVSVANNKKFHWVKVPGKITATPGQWPLLISNFSGKVILSKVIFSRDMKFVPH